MVIVCALVAAAAVAATARHSLTLRRRRLGADHELESAARGLQLLAAELRAGADTEAALDTAGLPPESAGPAQALRSAVDVSRQTGAQLAPLVDALALSVAAEATARREVQDGLVSARASGSLLCALPALGVVLTSVMGARPLSFLLHRPGCVALAAGTLLACAGRLWTDTLLTRAG